MGKPDDQFDLFGAPIQVIAPHLAVVPTEPEPEPEPELQQPAAVPEEEPETPAGLGGDDATGQLFLLDMTEPWRIEWNGMPEFSQEDQTPMRSILVHFESLGDVKEFEKLVGQSIGDNLKSIWYPEAEITRYADKRYASR